MGDGVQPNTTVIPNDGCRVDQQQSNDNSLHDPAVRAVREVLPCLSELVKSEYQPKVTAEPDPEIYLDGIQC